MPTTDHAAPVSSLKSSLALATTTEPISAEGVAAAEQNRAWTYGLPSLIVGIFSIALMAYGLLILPSRLPRWYAQQQSRLSEEFDVAVASNNSRRNATDVLTIARQNRIVYERLVYMSGGSAEFRWNWSQFDATASERISRWLRRDSGFLTNDEREQLQDLSQQMAGNARSLLASLSSESGSFQLDATLAFAKEQIYFPPTQRTTEDPLIPRLFRLSNAPLNSDDGIDASRSKLQELRLVAAEYWLDRNLQGLAGRSQAERTELLAYQNEFDQTLDLLPKNLEPRLCWVRLASSLPTNLKDATIVAVEYFRANPNANFDLAADRLADIKLRCFAGQWATINRLTADLLENQTQPLANAFIRRQIARWCDTLLISQLPAAQSAWAAQADQAQNFALRISPDLRSVNSCLFDVARGEIQSHASELVNSFKQTTQTPLSGILKSLAWTYHAQQTEADEAASPKLELSYLEPDTRYVTSMLTQLVLGRVDENPSEAGRLAILMQQLARIEPEQGGVWYALTLCQLLSGQFAAARESLTTAEKLLGQSENIEVMKLQIDRRENELSSSTP